MSPKHNILHVVNDYFVLPYFIGGQFLYFNARGFNIHVVCSPSDRLQNYAIEMEFKFMEVEILRNHSPARDLISLIAICKYIKKNKITSVFGHTPKGALLGLLAAWIMRVPKRTYFRHGLVYETMVGYRHAFMVFVERFTARLSTKIVCVSHSVAKESLKKSLNSEYKQIVLGKGTCGGIDALNKYNPALLKKRITTKIINRYKISTNSFIIGYCGRLVRDKGISELIQAFQLLRENSDRKYTLLLIGDYEERNPLSDKTKNIIANDSEIIKTGFIYNDLQYYYSLMNLFILPSYREGFPTSVLEASAMGVPVLTTKVTGCIDSIIEGETGLFISHSPDSIKEKILRIVQSYTTNSMGENGRKHVLDHFDNRILWPIIERELYR